MFKKFGRWLSALVGLIPMAAFAETSGPFTVQNTDISVKILSQLFGGLMPDGGTDAFHGAITTFNGAVLIVGGILATYTLLAGTLGTAHDGEMLGKKFSSVWIPIRYALGTALVLPVLTGGYCMMQQMVMWCILQGVGLANTVWVSYLESPALTVPVHMTSLHKKAVLEFAHTVALAQICVAANASVLNGDGTGGGLVDKISKSILTYDYRVAYNSDGSVAYFGDQHSVPNTITNMILRRSCGMAEMTELPSPQNIVPTTVSSGGKLGDISSAFQLGDISPVYQAHIDQAKKVIANMGTLAATAVNSDTALPEAEVVKAADAYVAAVEVAANGYANGNNSPFAGIIKASKTQGWILAGAWFTKLASINQQLNDAVNATPNASYVWQLGAGFKFLDTIQPKIGIARGEILEAMNISMPDTDTGKSDDGKGKITQGSETGSKIIQYIISAFTGLDLENLQNTEKPALLVLQDAGNRMVTMWSYLTGGLMGILTITGWKVLGNGWDAGPVVFTLIGFAFIPISALVGLGFTLAYLLPNLPFLMWIGIILGWVIMCVEAILAAPLWAVMHLHPNGDDLTGRGGNGYMLLLGLLLRPALTIFGLIAALVLTDVMGEFVNKIFFSVFFSGTGSGLVTILSVVFSITVYTSAMVQLFRKTFSLMHVIPDQLMRWIGGGQEQMGQYAGGLAEAGQKGVQAAGSAASFLGEKTAHTAGTTISQVKGIKDQRANTAAKEDARKSDAKSQEESLKQTMGESGISQMNKRTETQQQSLESSNPNSANGMKLRGEEAKMLKARSEGDSKVGSAMGDQGRKEFGNALAEGKYGNLTVGQMGDENTPAFEKEAMFANTVSNKMVSDHASKQQAQQEKSQQDTKDLGNQQLQTLQNIDSKLGKQNDSTTPSVVESGMNTDGKNKKAERQADMFEGDKNQEQAKVDLINLATATDINGNLINPTLAQSVTNAGLVSPFTRGLTPSAVNFLQGGGANGIQSPNAENSTITGANQTPIADPNSADGHSQSQGSLPFTHNPVDSSGNAQFNPVNSPSQSYDGSGSGDTGNNGNPNNFD